MSRKVSENSDESCAVCRETINIFAVGKCDHTVCMKCSVRMKVSCNQTYCPICRADLPEVWYLLKSYHYDEIRNKCFILHQTLNVHFEDTAIEDEFKRLLEHKCLLCKDAAPEKSFLALKTHMRKVHSLYYCDICVEHVTNFSFERKCYNRTDLALHRRTGDLNDSSHKGHPLCQFCDVRYLDNDELLRHLRKEHYFCHFCDARGSNQYYSGYDLLNDHFRDDHYLCEEGDCFSAQFVNAFPTEIDLKAHRALNHSTKRSAKLERTLDIDFNYTNRVQNRRDRNRGLISRDDYEEVSEQQFSRHGQGGGYRGRGRGNRRDRYNNADDRPKSPPKEIPAPDTKSTDDFPQMEGANNRTLFENKSKKSNSMASKIAFENSISIADAKIRSEDFPELSDGPTHPKANQTQNMVWNFNPTGLNDPFPALQEATRPLHTVAKHIERAPHPKVAGHKSPNKTATKSNMTGKPSLSSLSNMFVSDSLPTKQDVSNSHVSSSRRNLQMNVSSEKDFPSLASTAKNKSSAISSETWNTKIERKENKANVHTIAGKENNSPSKNPSGPSIIVNADDFPTLGCPVKPVTPSWVKVKTTKSTSNAKKVTPSPIILSTTAHKMSINKETGSNSESHKADNKVVAKKGVKEINADEFVMVQKKSKKQMAVEKIQDTHKTPETGSSEGKMKRKKNKKNKASKSTDDDDVPVESEQDVNILHGTVCIDDKISNADLNDASHQVNSEYDPFSEKEPVQSTMKLIKPPCFGEDDFPALGINLLVNGSVAGPSLDLASKLKMPPPGMTKFIAPPGFTLKQPSSLTVPISSVYTPPINAIYRNQQLISDIQECLQHDADKFNSFKVLSGQYRKKEIDAHKYYLSCRELVGSERFSILFSELLVLLPDIEKQQDLLVAYMEANHQEASALEITTCSVCQQVLLEKDLTSHQAGHDNDFPLLG